MKTLLFLGDSITDCDHCFDADHLGYGYVRKLAEHLSNTGVPVQLINHGTDGFTIARVLDRYRREKNELQPHVVTILAGINDIAALQSSPMEDDTKEALFSEIKGRFQSLIQEIRRHCDASVILMEPFLIPYPEEYRSWEPLLRNLQQDLKTLASDMDIHYLELQQHLTAACIRQGYRAISPDGIHLTDTGHELLSVIWLKHFRSLCTEK